MLLTDEMALFLIALTRQALSKPTNAAFSQDLDFSSQ